MVTVEKAIIAKLIKNGKHFEILVDSELAYKLKENEIVSIGKMLAINNVFTDSKKGMKASPSEIEKAFGTSDIEKIAVEIVKEGEVQLTTDFRRRKIEEKRKQIATIISRGAVDPRTKLPHPPERILNAIEEARANIDPLKSAESQINDIVKAIKTVLPLSFEEVDVTAEIPAQYSSKVYSALKEFGSFQEQWSGEKLIIKMKMPAALKEQFFRKINGLTGGAARVY